MPLVDDANRVLFFEGYIPPLLSLVCHIESPPNCLNQSSYMGWEPLREHASLLARIIWHSTADQSDEKNAGMCWHFPCPFANHRFPGSLGQSAAYHNALTV